MSGAHATAVVHPGARLGADVAIGPYAVVHEGVALGDGCRIGAGCVLHAGVTLGAGCELSEHVVLGGAPQDLAFDPGVAGGVEIGAGCRFREFVTVHRSTKPGGVTRIGADCFFMFSSHAAHDCVVEDGVVLAGYTALAGHVEVGTRAFLSGHVLVHQHVRIGRLAMVAGLTPVDRDVLPFGLLGRSPAVHYGLNRVGLKRAGVEGERYRELERAWRALRDGAAPAELPGAGEEVAHLRAWLTAPSRRGHAPLRRGGVRRDWDEAGE